jgi:thiamine biosynthesis lipoprotein
MNPFNPNSIISKVNRNEDVEVDDWFITVFNKAMEVSEKTDGYFDVTVAPLVNLWGFGFEKAGHISQHTIDSLIRFVGYKKVRLENRRVIKDDPRIKLNFLAIAKGYACDVIAELFEREKVMDRRRSCNKREKSGPKMLANWYQQTGRRCYGNNRRN